MQHILINACKKHCYVLVLASSCKFVLFCFHHKAAVHTMIDNNRTSPSLVYLSQKQKPQCQRQQRYRRQKQQHQYFFILLLLGTTIVPEILLQILQRAEVVVPYVSNQYYQKILQQQQQLKHSSTSMSFFLFVASEPYVLLKSKIPKCFQVMAPHSPKAIVEFKAPGT